MMYIDDGETKEAMMESHIWSEQDDEITQALERIRTVSPPAPCATWHSLCTTKSYGWIVYILGSLNAFAISLKSRRLKPVNPGAPGPRAAAM